MKPFYAKTVDETKITETTSTGKKDLTSISKGGLICPNCGAKLSCSCMYKIAKDGKRCCNRCVTNYNKSIS